MTQRYEALMLSVPEITQDEEANLEKGFTQTVRSSGGAVVSFERWGKYRLAYPIRKNDYGVYFLARFEAATPAAMLDEMKSFFAIKVNDVVMRNVVTKLDSAESLAYQRPRSLEEAPTSRDVDSFLKENKMEGLLPGASADKADADQGLGDVDEPDLDVDMDDHGDVDVEAAGSDDGKEPQALEADAPSE